MIFHRNLASFLFKINHIIFPFHTETEIDQTENILSPLLSHFLSILKIWLVWRDRINRSSKDSHVFYILGERYSCVILYAIRYTQPGAKSVPKKPDVGSNRNGLPTYFHAAYSLINRLSFSRAGRWILSRTIFPCMRHNLSGEERRVHTARVLPGNRR